MNLLTPGNFPAGFSFDTTQENAMADDNCDETGGMVGTVDFITIPQASEAICETKSREQNI